MRLEPLRVGFALGTAVGLAHVAWATLVAIGWAKPIVNLILWLHFLSFPVHVAEFDLGRACILVLVTFLANLVFGMFFAAVWNWVMAIKDETVAATPAVSAVKKAA